MLGTDWVANPIFKKNFFKDFLAVLQKQKVRARSSRVIC